MESPSGENPNSTKQKPQKEKVTTKNKKPFKYAWPIKAGILTLMLALMFGILSEVLLSNASIVIAIIVIVFLMAISIVFDVIGVAFACCPLEPILSMASRKVKGSKAAIAMVRRGDIVSSVCSDIIGDMCGILSGAAGAAVAAKIIMSQTGAVAVIIASVVSAVITALTVFGKAMCKRLAVEKCVPIVSFVSKLLSIFSKNK